MATTPTKTPKQQASLAGVWQGIEAPIIGILLSLAVAIQQYFSTHSAPNWGELGMILFPTVIVGIVQALKQFNATLGQASVPIVTVPPPAPVVSPSDIAAAIRQQVPGLVIQQPPAPPSFIAPSVPPGGYDTTLVQPLSFAPLTTPAQPQQPYTWSQPEPSPTLTTPAPVITPVLSLPSTFPQTLDLPIVRPQIE